MGRWAPGGLLAAAVVVMGITVTAPMAYADPGDRAPSGHCAPSWHDLPEEIKLSCIRMADVGTRVNLTQVDRRTHAVIGSWSSVASTQREFEELLAHPGETKIILLRGDENATFTLTAAPPRGVEVRAYDPVKVIVSGNGQMSAYGSARVRASDTAEIGAFDNSQVTAGDDVEVGAFDSSRVKVFGNARVGAGDNADVSASGNSIVAASGSSRVRAYGHAQVGAFDSVQVMTMGPVIVEVFSDRARVERMDTSDTTCCTLF